MSETAAGFKITQGKGFHITFQNGYTVSVQFGVFNFCNHAFGDWSKSPDAEVAVWKDDGDFIDLPQFDIDPVGGWKSPEEVLEILNWAKEREE